MFECVWPFSGAATGTYIIKLWLQLFAFLPLYNYFFQFRYQFYMKIQNNSIWGIFLTFDFFSSLYKLESS